MITQHRHSFLVLHAARVPRESEIEYGAMRGPDYTKFCGAKSMVLRVRTAVTSQSQCCTPQALRVRAQAVTIFLRDLHFQHLPPARPARVGDAAIAANRVMAQRNIMRSSRSRSRSPAAQHNFNIRVTGYRVEHGGAAFAVYAISSGEGRKNWHVERRWSEVRQLYYELWSKWKPQLKRASTLGQPRFAHHAYRIGSRKLDPYLLSARCRELEKLLVYFTSALRVSLERGQGPEILRLFLSEDNIGFARISDVVPQRRHVGLSERIGLFVPSPEADADSAHLAKPVDPPYRGRTELLPEELRAACDAPTPHDRYFTPAGGWPSCVATDSSRGRDACCQLLMAMPGALHEPLMSALDEATEFAERSPGVAAAEWASGGGGDWVGSSSSGSGGGIISGGGISSGGISCMVGSNGATASTLPPLVGELRVEVLEASGLPNLDTFSLTDAFALVLWEGVAARTCTIDDDLDPKWHAEAPRAFRLPIRKPYSTLFVALLDDDGLSVGGEPARNSAHAAHASNALIRLAPSPAVSRGRRSGRRRSSWTRGHPAMQPPPEHAHRLLVASSAPACWRAAGRARLAAASHLRRVALRAHPDDSASEPLR